MMMSEPEPDDEGVISFSLDQCNTHLITPLMICQEPSKCSAQYENDCMKMLLGIVHIYEAGMEHLRKKKRVPKGEYVDNQCENFATSYLSNGIISSLDDVSLSTAGFHEGNGEIDCRVRLASERGAENDSASYPRKTAQLKNDFSCYKNLRSIHFTDRLAGGNTFERRDQTLSQEEFDALLHKTVSLLLLASPAPLRREDLRNAWMLGEKKCSRRFLFADILANATIVISRAFGFSVAQAKIGVLCFINLSGAKCERCTVSTGTTDVLYLRQGVLFPFHICIVSGPREIALRGFLLFLKMNFMVYGDPLPFEVIAANLQHIGWNNEKTFLDCSSVLSTMSKKYPLSLDSAAELLAECSRLRYIYLNKLKIKESNDEASVSSASIGALPRLKEEFNAAQFVSSCKDLWNCIPPRAGSGD